MQIKIDDSVVFEISDVDVKLLEHDLINVEAEIRRRLEYIIKHKVEQCYKRLKDEWDKKLAEDPKIKSVPSKRDDYVSFITRLPSYQNRVERESNG